MRELGAIIELYLDRQISPEVCLARMILAGATPDEIDAVLAPLATETRDLRQLAQQKRHGLDQLATLARCTDIVNIHSGPVSSVAKVCGSFDLAVGVSAEASVAAYSLGDPAILAAATTELVRWLSDLGLLSADSDVLDFGCGIGRVAEALAPRVRSILGIDVSAAMIGEARQRSSHTNVRFETTDGDDLARLHNRGYDLVLAVDSIPYLFQAGVAERHIADFARILRPRGVLVFLNLSYRNDLEADRADARRWAAIHGFDMECAGEKPFLLWDGCAFILRRTSSDLASRWVTAIRRGDFATGHAISDFVLARRDPRERDDPNQPYHCRWVWDGRSFEQRHVLVRCYHGLGDTLMFARFLPKLRRQAASVTVELQPELVELFSEFNGVDRLIPFNPARPTAPGECDIEITELLHALRVDSTQLAAWVPYLSVPTAAVAACKERLPRDAFNVGLCWRVGAWLPERSVPLGQLAAACALPGVRFVSLQRGPASEEARTVARFHNSSAPPSILATACLVTSLDLVITVDSMIAHLAGALGRQVWLLLSRDADWRWMQGRDDTPWYPSTRLYRQINDGDWGPPLASLAADLKNRLANSLR
jgi:SAM-dependent methyltransferase